MKNKKLIYILIPLVVALWGTIIYRIFHTVNNKNTDSAINKNIFTSTMQNQTVPDTFSIHPVYSDPFLRHKNHNTNHSKIQTQGSTNVEKVKKITKPEPSPVASLPWPGITYNGLVKNQKSNKQLAMVQINGQAGIMQVGDILSEVKLLNVTKDSIETVFHNEKKIFKK